jgi:hypothetical protein
MQQRSSVAVDRDTVLDLNQIRLDLARQEAQSVPLGEVVRRLIAVWHEQGGQDELTQAVREGTRPVRQGRRSG